MRPARRKLIELVAQSIVSYPTAVLREIEKLDKLYGDDDFMVDEQDINGTHFQSDDVDSQRKVITIEIQRLLKKIERDLRRELKNISEDISQIHGLHSRWNTLSPVARLPPEIVFEVFLQLKTSHLAEFEDFDMFNYRFRHQLSSASSSWQVVSRVCRTWRSLALDHAVLWTVISFAWVKEKIYEFLSRSKQANLQIYDVRTARNSRVLAEILPRVEVLQVFKDEDVLDLDQSAPMLKEFIFDGGVLHRRNLFTTLLRADAAPQLHRLHIKAQWIELPKTFGHPTLRSLRIDETIFNDYQYAYNGILAVLAAFPRLEALELNDCFPLELRSPDFDNDHIDIVRLSQLRSVKLRGREVICANLLGFLDIPRDCSVWVRANDISLDITAVERYTAKFNKYYPTQHMVVGGKYMQFVPSDSNIVTHPSGQLSSRRLGPEFILEASVITGLWARDVLPHGGLLSQVVKLTVSCDITTDYNLSFIFEQVPGLKTLHVHGAARADEFFTNMTLDVRDLLIQELLRNFVPIKDVVLESGFRCPRAVWDTTRLPQLRELILGFFPSKLAAKRLVSCLVTRRSYGLGPDVVRIRCSEAVNRDTSRHPSRKMTRKKLERLRVFVENIGWTNCSSYITFE